MVSRPGSLLLAVVLGAGCASSHATRDKPAPEVGATINGTPARLRWSPLSGDGPGEGEIPSVLLQAMDAPYAHVNPSTCANLAAAIAELDDVLGGDVDDTAAKADQDNVALYLLSSGIRGFIPYYGWIRWLTGAERQKRRALAAVAAGNARRGYLKGVGEARGCPPPASPNRRSGVP